MDRSINSVYTDCGELFDILAKATSQQLLGARLTDVTVQDELDRFKIWGGNMGAGHSLSTKISLDWRLRDATELKEEAIQLLEEIAYALKDLQEIVSGAREDQVTIIDAEDEEEGGVVTVSEAAELFGIISDSIAGLFRLSLIIQKATPRDRFMKALTNVQEPFDPIYDMQHVGAKFPKLDRDKAWLLKKLATAITQRRQFFRYSRDHQERKSKLKSERPAMQLRMDRLDQPQADVLSRLHPGSLVQTQASTLVLDRLDVARANVEEADDSLSQTSFATSVDESHDSNRLRVPRLEDVSGRSREFECPYCCAIIAPRSQRQWKKHVFEDLRPYLCTSEDCDVKLFTDRRTWFDHELSKHRCLYRCLFCQSEVLQSEQELHKHVSMCHGEMAALNTPDKLFEAAKEAPRRLAAAECPFCDGWTHHLRTLNPHISTEDVTFVKPKQFQNHLAAHMEQLALFALPRRQNDDADSNSEGVFANRTHSSEGSAHETDQAQSSEQAFDLIHDDYTVALISSVSAVDELALRMLDKQHPNLPVSSLDSNHYSLGQIGYHNVILVTPRNEAGNDNVISMTNLMQTFPKLRFGFSIETGSGVPSEPNEDPQLDLHLGDVVVNHQRSMDEELPDELKTTGLGSTLKGTLPLAVRYALRSIPSQIENEGPRIRLFLDPILLDGSVNKEKYNYPGEAWDQLFAFGSVQRKSGQKLRDKQVILSEIGEINFDVQRFSPGQKMFPPCDNCRAIQIECIISTDRCMQCEGDKTVCRWQKFNTEDLIARNTREDPSIPAVHTGKIVRVSESTPDAELTPIPGQSGSVLCIEKDSKYLPTALPCLIVRGIADYGFDQPYFKGIDWQGYAIGVATAYAIHILDWIQESLDHRDSEWLLQKQRISRLYQSGHSIPDIQNNMRKSYGFDATPFQYQRKITAWKLVRPNTAEHRYLNQEDQLAEPIHNTEEPQASNENFAIKCICLASENDGYTVLCNGCNTWQHIECYYELEHVPKDHESHYCVDCQPRDINMDRAMAVQSRRRDQVRNESKGEMRYETHRALEELKRLKEEKDHEREEIGKEYMREQLRKDGYSEEQIEFLMKKGGKKQDNSSASEQIDIDEDHEEFGPKWDRGFKPVGEMSYETRRALEELKRLKEGTDHEELVQKMEKEFRLKEAKAHEEHEKKMKEIDIDGDHEELVQKMEKEFKEKEREEIGKEYMRAQLRKDGYSEEQIEYLMNAGEQKKGDHSSASEQIVIAERPTYLKVHEKHIAPETLDHFKIKWQWADSEHIYITDWITEADQDILFEHTERLRERKYTKFAEVETANTNMIQKDRTGRLLMVRKKDEKRQRSKSPTVVKRYYLDD